MTVRRQAVSRTADRERGASTVEVVVLTPVLLAILLTIVALGRLAHSRELVDQAAGVAARAASLAGAPAAATQQGTAAGRAALTDAGLSCTDIDITVGTDRFRAGGEVTATVACTADLTDVALGGLPGHTTMTATATVPLETYRQISGFGR